MKFKTYLNQAWEDHVTQSSKVADEFSKGSQLVETNEQLAQLVGIVTHVMGEHLGRWEEGHSILQGFRSHLYFKPGTETEKAIWRSMAALKAAANPAESLDSFTLSDKIRILTVAASALSERDTFRAQELLHQALKLSESGLEKNDPANRSLAVTGNNLACALEEKKSRTELESQLMVLAAQTGRKFWELAGTWYEVSIAEYRLAMTYLQINDPSRALLHAQNNLEILRENQPKDYDMFFGYQALALAEKQKGNESGFETAAENAKRYYEKLNDEDKSFCEAGLRTLG